MKVDAQAFTDFFLASATFIVHRSSFLPSPYFLLKLIYALRPPNRLCFSHPSG